MTIAESSSSVNPEIVNDLLTLNSIPTVFFSSVKQHHHPIILPINKARPFMHDIPSVSIDDLIERYETLLFDAYGVLVDRDGPLPGAIGLLNRLLRLGVCRTFPAVPIK